AAAEDMLRDAVLQLVGVAGDVDIVEAQDSEEVANAAHIAVDEVRLDGVPKLWAEEADEGFWRVEGAFDGRRPDVDLDLNGVSVDGIGQLVRRCVRAVGCGAAAGVKGF